MNLVVYGYSSIYSANMSMYTIYIYMGEEWYIDIFEYIATSIYMHCVNGYYCMYRFL